MTMFLMFSAPCAVGITKPTIRKVTNAMKPVTKLSVISAVSKALIRTALTTAARITLMNDITELARERLKEKFDAWFEREYKHLESSKYTDAVPHIKYGFWTAYQAGGAELVEALEKAQAKADVYDMLRDDYGLREKGVGLADFVDWQAKRIAELDSRAVNVENLQESAYRAGLTAGWNLGLANNNDGFNKCLAAHTAGIKVEAE
ncbi:TPA: hypothetical protein MYK22_001012 [Klebsiella pneumoniae]|nr:hypothetical protein [Klebsiella pneumoniae]